MISFSNINKQYGKQLLFVDASFQLNPGDKVGLVGPNGAGKTTLFRMVVGEESPDEGAVSVPKKLTIGYFRQDVEEMQGRSVLDEAIAGSGRVGDLHHELEALQREMSDPDKADDMDRILDRFGHVQEEYEHLGGYALESQAREVLHGLGFKDDQIDGDVGSSLRRMENAGCAGTGPARNAGCIADGRTDEPPRHRIRHLAGAVSQVISWRAAHDLARPRVHESPGFKDCRDR
jgi:energy-coupling factor transporter ATP-binding protein EcfA2